MGLLLGRKGLCYCTRMAFHSLFSSESATVEICWVCSLSLNLQPIDKTSIKARLCVFASFLDTIICSLSSLPKAHNECISHSWQRHFRDGWHHQNGWFFGKVPKAKFGPLNRAFFSMKMVQKCLFRVCFSTNYHVELLYYICISWEIGSYNT